jgi:hypothetical protein
MSEQFNFKSEKLRQIIEFIELNPNQFTISDLANRFNVSYDTVQGGIRRAKKRYTLVLKPDTPEKKKFKSERKEEYIPPPPNTETVLIIGDLHEPFTLEGYLEFCIDTYKKYKCTHVVFIGDIVDNHAISYHESDADGMSAGDELDEAIDNLAKWYKAFPKADVIIGNHDRLIMRKAFTGGIPRRWILGYQDMFGVPGWNFKERQVYDGVQYIHGEGGTARARCKKDLMSTVQGHLHTQAYTEHLVGSNFHIFGTQVGCGVDKNAYAMTYAKDYGKPAIGVAVVMNSGKLPINILMPL